MEARLVDLLGEPVAEAVVVSSYDASPGEPATDAATAAMLRDVRHRCGYLYLVAGATRVALLPFERGSLRAVRGPAVFECPRDAVRQIDVDGRGLTRRLVLHLRDGSRLALDVPRSQSGRLDRFVASLRAA